MCAVCTGSHVQGPIVSENESVTNSLKSVEYFTLSILFRNEQMRDDTLSNEYYDLPPAPLWYKLCIYVVHGYPFFQAIIEKSFVEFSFRFASGPVVTFAKNSNYAICILFSCSLQVSTVQMAWVDVI